MTLLWFLASAAMEDFLPYFNDVIELLKTNLVPSEDDKLDKLRTQAVGMNLLLNCITCMLCLADLILI